MNNYIPRQIAAKIQSTIDRGESVLLLGPRQTGKTTVLKHDIKPDISITFADVKTRQLYEKNPPLLSEVLDSKIKELKKTPVILIDEVQKIPIIMDTAQLLIDDGKAQFILTGSSARKLKTGKYVNLLPGRVIALTMTPLMYTELPDPKPNLNDLLIYGSLPKIVSIEDKQHKEESLHTYVVTYLEDEIRAEAAVRNLGQFARFLEIAAGEAGRQLNFTKLSHDIGIPDSTIVNYYQILEDCLITHRIDPLTQSKTKRRLVRSPKYLFFDLGIRRVSANEGVHLSHETMSHLFEQYVGLELINQSKIISPHLKIKYWRDNAGPEVDFVVDDRQTYTPIEVKWSERPRESDAKHLKKFIDEYDTAQHGYIVCRAHVRFKITENITAIPWQEIDSLLDEICHTNSEESEE